jgi:diguanylate cyclase (GGDEF)-like protein
MYYASIGLIALIVHVIINMEALKKVEKTAANEVRIKYRHFLFAVTVFYISDSFWGVFYELKLIAATYACTIVFFASMVASVLLWTRAVVAFTNEKSRLSKVFLTCGWIIFGLQILALIVNFFYPIVFTFTEDQEYIALSSRYLTLFLQMILFLATAIYSFIVMLRSKGQRRSHFRIVGFSGIIMATLIFLQMFDPFLPLYSLGCLFATCMIHTFIHKDMFEEQARAINSANKKAYVDSLTGVKNKLAYIESLRQLELDPRHASNEGYGVVVFDVNGLKKVNDTQGHEAGDELLRNACKLICEHYKHSPVYRIGGDEFAVILKGSDFENREEIKKQFDDLIDVNNREGKVVVSSGMAVFDSAIDESYTEVFIRADKSMYERKQALKAVAA